MECARYEALDAVISKLVYVVCNLTKNGNRVHVSVLIAFSTDDNGLVEELSRRLQRSWYERDKHIFPASCWEPYDPTKTYKKYTCHDRKKAN